jgi:DNA-binding NarL/FixJ family response regulator
MTEIRTLIADDHPIFRRGLRVVIESDKILKVVAEVDNGEAAINEIRSQEPDVAVLDVDMPGADGLEVARRIRDENLPTLPVFLTMHKDEGIFNAALAAGVRGFVIKDSAATNIVTCIKTVVTGRSFFSAELTQFLLDRQSTRKSLLEDLTEAECRVLRLIAQNKTSREIAGELFISVRTVEHHRANMSNKLGLTGKNALLAFAITNKALLV